MTMNLDRRLTFSYAMNKLESGIIGLTEAKAVFALEQSLP